ncbi:MAG: hypothetical protein JWM28_3202 [Chitinophagaceae bacterium]|nr:hypothetical protein [Chitinophagaceae bacterium]
MTEKKGAYIIQALRKKWIAHSILSDLLFSMGPAFLFSIILNKLFEITLWSIPGACLAIFLLLLFIRSSWKVKDTTIAQLLNQDYPQLQESSGLLLKDYSSLNILEQLQHHKTEVALSSLPAPLHTAKRLNKALAVSSVLLTAGFILYYTPIRIKHNLPPANTHLTNVQPSAEKILPQLADARIIIKPPAYTSQQKREQDQFNLSVEEGSMVNWQLNTTLPAKNIKFIFNDSLSVALKPTDSSHISWRLDKTFSSPGFYQLAIDGNLSELYKIEIIRDQPPVIHIQSPEPYTTIDFGEPQKVLMRLEMTDDYGIQDAYISTTIASGSGEGVKFKERKIALPGFAAGKTQYQLQKLLSLPESGMQPGDELYFFITATDNRQQESRSDIYIINLPDTADLMSVEGLANSLNVKPEYFRSQRQIIIETEQLLKDKDTLSMEAFRYRSNNLGIDQKMLRLRYGKFLGEEDEPGETGSENRDELQDPANFSNAEKLKEAFTDQHDKAEDATFFEPGIKKQLKATLTEMWNAELPLRTFKPQEALPFEYKALRLLKDLQQKTRAYVAKTNSKTTPIDLQKRLTGDLSKITEPKSQKDIQQNEDPQNPIREALGTLEQLKLSGNTNNISPQSLRRANILLNEKAVEHPSLYLPAVQAMRRITSAFQAEKGITKNDIITVEIAFQKILQAPSPLPSAGKTSTRQSISEQYFINLNRSEP